MLSWWVAKTPGALAWLFQAPCEEDSLCLQSQLWWWCWLLSACHSCVGNTNFSWQGVCTSPGVFRP